MATVKGPLLSMRASGTIGKNIVFASWRGIQYTRQHVIPSNPQSAGQVTTRTTFAWLNDAFRHFGPLAKQPWGLAAAGRPFTDRNAFIKANLPLLRPGANLEDYIASPGVRGGPALEDFTAVAGGLSGEIDLAWTSGPLPVGWGIDSAIASLVPQQNSHDALNSDFTESQVANPGPYFITLAGLTPAQEYACSGWLIYTRDDGAFAASPSNLVAVTATA
jgi:hypothetical protein